MNDYQTNKEAQPTEVKVGAVEIKIDEHGNPIVDEVFVQGEAHTGEASQTPSQ
jgi:hypothetical protein